ncbi:MAG: bifunctional lysylphosphatidylglycerol flippase/synthetase MprF, partial [Planctomycetes bacterium]|nr:bifunctional lysylphosphatidylglycerol flippase/synthetase MprF [Planctomycetota bacterium]
AVRYRIYSSWGISAMETAKVALFCGFTLWLGFCGIAGVSFLFEPLPLPQFLHFPFTSVRPVGAVLLALLGGYILWASLSTKPLKIRGWELHVPGTRLALAQTAISCLDWVVAAGVLYVLLPPAASLPCVRFLGIFMLAQSIGLVSQIPGGLGAFEVTILFLLSPNYSTPAILGALLTYRGIYYLLPFAVACLILAANELLERKKAIRQISSVFGRWVPAMIPHVFAVIIFSGGIILLFSGALPAEKGRLSWLRDFLPLPAIELSHFLASLAGLWLLILARGLQRRLDAAYHLTIVLLVSGIVLSLAKGLDYEEAIILSLMLAALLPCRLEFYRKASLLNQKFTPGWVAAIITVLLCSVWLGLFSYKHIEYSNTLWWKFTFSDDSPKFLRATAGALSFALIFALTRLFRTTSILSFSEPLAQLEKVKSIVAKSGYTCANLALLGDKKFLFSHSGNAFIMYAVEGRSWIAMGNPVGPEQEWDDLIWQFYETCRKYGGWPVFYEIQEDKLRFYFDLGLSFFKIGEEGRICLKDFSLEGSARKNLRYICHKFEREGYTVKVVSPCEVENLLDKLKIISDAWLQERNTREKRFSIGRFDEQYLKFFPAAVVLEQGKIIAFVNLWCGADKNEISIDLMRYLPGSPEGLMDYLFCQLMLWSKQQGYRWFSLGMAPLSGVAEHTLGRRWNQAVTFVFRYGGHFYNFQGLRRYKEKFKPDWQPKYIICPGGLVVPRILVNLVSLISGGIKGAVTK